MARQYQIKDVLRQIERGRLKQLFEKLGCSLNVNWDDLGEKPTNTIHSAWLKLPLNLQEGTEVALQDIHDVATPMGTESLVAEGRELGQELAEELGGLGSHYDRAVVTYLHYPEVFKIVSLVLRSETLSSRYWRKRTNVSKVTPKTDGAVINDLAAALSSFYREHEGRGYCCTVEYHKIASGDHYYFAYPDDHADKYVGHGDQGELVRKPERRTFEVIFVYNKEAGELDMYVQAKKETIQALQDLFGRIILNGPLGPEDRSSRPYELNGLKSRSFNFATDMEDHITAVRVRHMRLAAAGNPRHRVTFEANPDGPPDDIYNLLDDWLNQRNVPMSSLLVTQVGLEFDFADSLNRMAPSLTFNVSWPNSSNLKSKRPELKAIGEKYLKKWGIQRV